MRPIDIRPEHIIAARRELTRRSLADFACMIDIPTVPLTEDADEDRFSVMRLGTLTTHHALLLSKLQAVVERRIPNLMVFMPPGSAKSLYTDVVLIPWFMARNPRSPVILASYATAIAEKQGRRARQLIESPGFRNLMGIGLRSDQKAAALWTLENGSEFMAGGLMSGITGNRAALGVLDDPLSGRADAESDTIRQKSWDAYIDDFCSRLKPGAPQIIIMTRWHEDDIAGRILPVGWDGESGLFTGRDRRQWEVLCLPAEADRADDPLGRKIGDGLWPEYFLPGHWEPFKANGRTWTSLYQQKPRPQEGTFFRREWFRRYRIGSEPKALNNYLTTDHAPGGEADSDFTCARIWGIDPKGDVYLRDGFRTQETLDKSVDKIIGNQKTWKPTDHERPRLDGLLRRYKPFAWFPEGDNNYKAVAGFVRRRMLEELTFVRIEPISPHGADKKTKAQPFQGLAASGKVWLPEGPEGDDVLEQYVAFPGGRNDDEVDTGALIGRAIDEAHAALVPHRDKVAGPDDRWNKAFEHDDDAEESWKST